MKKNIRRRRKIALKFIYSGLAYECIEAAAFFTLSSDFQGPNHLRSISKEHFEGKQDNMPNIINKKAVHWNRTNKIFAHQC